MNVDQNILDLLLQWEEAAAKGTSLDPNALVAGRPDLAPVLMRHIDGLKRVGWLIQVDEADVRLPLPPPNSLAIAMLLPEGLTVEKLHANVVKADIVDPKKLQQLLEAGRPKTSTDFSQRLLKSELLTRFQLKAIAHGRTNGLKLGRYVILEKLGEGGMGQVFKARHSKMGRLVALKVLPRDAMSNVNNVARFLQEVRVASKLSHPNVVTAYDADEAGGFHFLVMEYVDGCDLNSIVRRNGPLSTAKTVDYILQAARGLQYAHQVGLVHRDIKPANLLLDATGKVQVLDMGIARIHSDEPGNLASLTQNGVVMGTVDYMSPEQAIDAKTVDARADLYSLGCTLYYLLTRRPPFEGDALMVKLLGHREQPPPSLHSLRRDVPPELEAVYQKCMAKIPDFRYQTATELIADLERIYPLLCDESSEYDLLPAGQELETAPTGMLETQSQFAPITLAPSQSPLAPLPPAITIESKPHRRRSPQRPPYALYGAALGAMMLLFGGYFAMGALFKVKTPSGNLVVEIDEEDFVAHLRDRELTLVNVKTNESMKIQLTATEQTSLLSPGEYRFALETSAGIKTDVSEVAIVSDGSSLVHVSWEAEPDRLSLDAKKASPNTATTDSSADAPWIDLLSMVKLPNHVINGSWQKMGTKFLGNSNLCRLMTPYAVRGSYRLELEFSRLDGNDGIAVSLPIDETSCDLAIDWRQGKCSGLQRVDRQELEGQRRGASSLAEGVHIETAKLHQLAVEVIIREPSVVEISAQLDKQVILNWRGDKSQLVVNAGASMFPLSQTPGICCFDKSFEIRGWRLQLLENGEAERLNDADWGSPFYEVAPSPPQSVINRCVDWNGKRYFVTPTPVSWSEAQKIAKTYRGRVLTLSSPEEEAFIVKEMRTKHFWMSGWQVGGNKRWRDERNRPLKYFGQWYQNNPDNRWGNEPVLGYFNGTTEKGWNDFNADYSIVFAIIEWGEEYSDGTYAANSTPTTSMTAESANGTEQEAWPDGEWRTIFNGRDLQGWTEVETQGWRVEDGALIGGPGWGWLVHNRREGNFELELEYRHSRDFDSGIRIAAALGSEPPTGPNMELQLIDDESPSVAGVPQIGLTGSLYGIAASKPLSPLPKPSEWRRLTVRHDGRTTVVTIRGEEVLRYTASSDRPAGHIALQKKDGTVEFRNIRMRTFSTPVGDPGAEKESDFKTESIDFSHESAFDPGAEWRGMIGAPSLVLTGRDDNLFMGRAYDPDGSIREVVGEVSGEIVIWKSREEASFRRYAVGLIRRDEQGLQIQCIEFDEGKKSQFALTAIPSDAKAVEDSYCKVIAADASWGDARSQCQRLGGRLAEVHSEVENAVLSELVRESSVDVAWIGASYAPAKSAWRWLSDHPMNYTNWDIDNSQPDNLDSGENYVAIASNRGGKWWNYPNDLTSSDSFKVGERLGFICQWNPVSGEKFSPASVDENCIALKDLRTKAGSRGFSTDRWRSNIVMLVVANLLNEGNAEFAKALAKVHLGSEVDGNRKAMLEYAIRFASSSPLRNLRTEKESRVSLSDVVGKSPGGSTRNRLPESENLFFIRPGGREFHEKGLANVGSGVFVFDLNRDWSQFTAVLGVHPVSGPVRFTVKGDGREIMRWDALSNTETKSIKLDVRGITELELIASEIDKRGVVKPIWASPYVER